MKGIFLDYKSINLGDLDWEAYEEVFGKGNFEAYEDSTPKQMKARCADAEAVFTDSCTLDREFIEACPKLRFIGCAATGYNNVDLDAAREHGIAVCNVPAYSREAVAQHAISLLLHITNRVHIFKKGRKTKDIRDSVPYLLDGKSIGIIGYGSIGSRVAEIAEALGMTVNIYSRDPEAVMESDVISLHCPLTDENRGMINEKFIKGMKDGAILINTARGGLVDEAALAGALKSGKLLAAGLDVTASEPPEADCPLLECDNCYITPHMAFMAYETRKKVLDICVQNLQSFLSGGKQNRIV